MSATARRFAATAVLVCAATLPLRAQEGRMQPPPYSERVSLSGPRFGVTLLPNSLVDSLAAHDVRVGAVITQFGWQFEKLFLGSASGPAMVTEWVVLVGGLEQGVVLPSLNWMVGIRTPGGTEFGVGPNISAAGAALVIAGGVTHRVGAMNLPLNVAVVPSRVGTRISVLTGFTTR